MLHIPSTVNARCYELQNLGRVSSSVPSGKWGLRWSKEGVPVPKMVWLSCRMIVNPHGTWAFWKVPVHRDRGPVEGCCFSAPGSGDAGLLILDCLQCGWPPFSFRSFRMHLKGTLLYACAVYIRGPENWTRTLYFGKVVDPNLEDFAAFHLHGGGPGLLKTSFPWWLPRGVSGNLLNSSVNSWTTHKKVLPQIPSLAKLYLVCDLECSFPTSRGIFVSAESFGHVRNEAKLLICSLSRPLTIVLLSAFTLMRHAFIARTVHFLKIYDYLFCFFMLPERLIIAVLGTLT